MLTSYLYVERRIFQVVVSGSIYPLSVRNEDAITTTIITIRIDLSWISSIQKGWSCGSTVATVRIPSLGLEWFVVWNPFRYDYTLVWTCTSGHYFLDIGLMKCTDCDIRIRFYFTDVTKCTFTRLQKLHSGNENYDTTRFYKVYISSQFSQLAKQ